MNPGTFSSNRRDSLATADEMIAPAVADALRLRPASRWFEGIVDAAAQVWLENFEAEAPGAKYDSALSRFRSFIEDSLRETSETTNAVRITHWASTLAVNAGTMNGAAALKVSHKMWVSMSDDKVRDTHDEMDGVIVPMGGVFTVAGHKLPYPGAPVGPPEVWIECRCVAMPASRDGGAMSANTFTITNETILEDEEVDGISASAEYHVDRVEEGTVATEIAKTYVVQRDYDEGTCLYGPFASEESAHAFTDGDGEYTVIPVEGFEMAEIIADPEPETDEDDDDDDGFSDEIPIHGVLAPEGVETGDRRGFRDGALSSRPLPVPFRYEAIGTHGGMTSDVVTVGRIDEAWRDEATKMWRFRGALIMSKPHANESLENIIDGSGRGVSIDADAMTMDLSNQTEEEWEKALAEGSSPTSWYKTARVAGLTQVPIPAFHEAYVALGHEFEEDKTPEQREADAAALAACGCLDSIDTEALATGGVIATPDRMMLVGENGPEHVVPLTSAFAQTLRDAALKTFAPGTKDGPGWITNPRATARIRRYWVHGEGAAKIRWGTGGDFNRCRRLLAKYVQNPEWLAGLCANMHYEALGFWPATHAKQGRHSLIAAGGVAAEPLRLVRAAGGAVYPADAFAEPEGDHAFAMRIDREARTIYGYAAKWGECHIGIQGVCREAPHSNSDYSYFRKGVVQTDEGEQSVALITYGIGHASELASAAAATAHYDQTDAVRAYINIGENQYGIWYAGVLAPWVTDDDIDAMLAIRRVSGDWRNWSGRANDLEMVGLVVVNTEGFQLAASGGVQTVAIGFGVVEPEDDDFLVAAGETHEDFVRRVSVEVADFLAARERRAALQVRIDAMRQKDLRARAREKVS
jgi:hypothetical protein